VPSPLGHALAGIAAGWLVQPAPIRSSRSAVVGRICLFAAVGAAPDLDLLAGAHSGPTHGLGASVIVGVLAWVVPRVVRQARPATDDSRLATSDPRPATRFAVAVAAAYATHILLDWLGTDTSPPIGIMALWPFSHAYYESSAHLFMAISRRYWLPEFWTYNLIALGRELLVLLPIAALVMRARRWA
jgi:hypothetical protein